MTRIPNLLAALCLILPGVSAQTINLRTLALQDVAMPELTIRAGKDQVPLHFSTVQPAEVIRATAANPLPLYRNEVTADGKPVLAIAHSVKIPDQASGVLLLGWKDEDKPRFIAIKDEYAKADYNDWLLINASRHPVAFQAGENARPLLLKPGVSTTHRIAAAKDEGIAVTAQAPIKGKARTFYSTFWPVYADKRSLVIFVDDGERILVKRISDQLAKREPEENPG